MSKSNYHAGRKSDNCYFCNSWKTEEHHIVPQRFGGKDKPSNIVELCSQCHKRIERLYDTSFYEWFGIDDEKGERKHHRPCSNSDCKAQVTQHWRNTLMDADFYVCDEHVVDIWPEDSRFEFVEALNR